MSKPGWLKRREEDDNRTRVHMKRCVECRQKGDACGFTNNIPKRGRLPMYECRKLPGQIFYEDTLACEHFESR